MLPTCNAFVTVKSQANTTVSSFTANSPNTQVQPSRGTMITAALSNDLITKQKITFNTL